MKRIIVLLLTSLMLVSCGVSITKQDPEFYQNPLIEGAELMNSGDVEAALEIFLEANDHAYGDDTALNNISWAYNELAEYELSVEYIEQALEIKPNDSIEYVNAGNAYAGLDQYEEAISHYESSISLNDSEFFAFYGLAMAYYNLEQYQTSLEYFGKALELEDDFDTEMGYLECLILLESYEESYVYLEGLLDHDPLNEKLHEYKSAVLELIGDEEAIVQYYDELEILFPTIENLHLNIPIYFYDTGQYMKAADYIQSILREHNDEITNLWMGYALKEAGEIDEAYLHAEYVTMLNDTSVEGHSLAGKLKYVSSDYLQAADHFLIASKYDESVNSYINLSNALYYAQRYDPCIEYSLEALDLFGPDYNLLMKIAYAYYMKDEHDQAIKYYELALHMSKEDATIYYDIAESYFYLEDNVKATEYINIYLNINPGDENALGLQQEINSSNESSGVLLSKLFKENYLYGFDKDLSYTRLNALKDEAVEEILERVKDPEDLFTFMIYGDDYTDISTRSEELELYNVTDSTYYIQIPYFDNYTDLRFIKAIDQIDHPEYSDLIIDLQSNSGGDTVSANNILNALLPECVSSQIIYKDGNTYSFYSDATMTKFNHIYILVDEYSASASELVSLSLSTYLDNTTIVGAQTFGKGVGQYVYDDHDNNRLYFIVNHFWNVRQTNISDIGITPDVILKKNEINDYLFSVIKN